ncbi:MAG: DNA-processing protein DprA [Muribaculum sp.]|nr:DNA-processing protein DprA [Muribaculum sp.]
MIDIYRIAFASLRGITRQLAGEILARAGSEQNFFEASEQELTHRMACRSNLFASAYRQEVLERACREIDFMESNHVKTYYFTDSEYPVRLTECDDAPLLLFGLGDADLNASHVVSIVGTRHSTPYGLKFVDDTVKELAAKIPGIMVVSGLAYGIDVAAHRSSMINGVPTIGVLAHGLNTMYPAVHRQIAADMVRHGGMLVTEYSSQTQMHKGNFLARNRIVAGLADCIIVAESAEKGGALVTANIAAEYSRDVFALPGRISDKFSRGCNKLIARNVAQLVENADDIIRAMRWVPTPEEGAQQSLPVELSADEAKVVAFLRDAGEGTLNGMCVKLAIPINRLMPLLVDMEFKELIITYPGGKYRLA